MKIFSIIPFDPGTDHQPRNLGRIYNEHIAHLPDDCWISIQDYDVMWPQVTIPSMLIMYNYIEAYPETGLFTSYASRTKNPAQKFKNGVYEKIDSLIFWRDQANELIDKYHPALEYEDISHEISGFHMLFSKKIWEQNKFPENLNLLRVDNEFSWGIHRMKKPVRLMKALLCIHYYRIHKDINDTSHLIQ